MTSMTASTTKDATALRLVTIILIAAMTQSIVIGIHESVHAITCMAVGYSVVEYSALHVDCQPEDILNTPTKVVAGSSAIVNLILGVISYFVLRSGSGYSSNMKWFLWLFMFANLSNGFGYLIFSGISGAGDYAAVIAGWEPASLWQIAMLLLGAVLWFGAVWLSLRVLALIFGGSDSREIRSRFLAYSVPSYLGAVLIIVGAGLLNMHGFLGLPSVAGILAAAGTLSPLLWMPFWFASNSFRKQPLEPLTIRYDVRWIAAAAIICLVYVLVLGSGFRLAGA